jgi:hypothetical protein
LLDCETVAIAMLCDRNVSHLCVLHGDAFAESATSHCIEEVRSLAHAGGPEFLVKRP